jgi:hypothetical protein
MAQIPAKATSADVLFGDAIRVVAYDAPKRVAPNTSMVVRVFWQAQASISQDNDVSLSLIAEDGTILWERSRRPGRGLVPTPLWERDKVVPDIFTVRVPANAPRGQARLVVRVAERGGDFWRTEEGRTDGFLTHVTIE